jgi:hypothetical protein
MHGLGGGKKKQGTREDAALDQAAMRGHGAGNSQYPLVSTFKEASPHYGNTLLRR